MGVIVSKRQIAEAAEKAALCDHVYFRDPSAPPPEGWRIVCTSDELMPGKRSFFGALYAKTDPATGRTDYTVAFRGSDGNDLTSNFMIAAGRLPPQHKDAVTFTKLAAEKAGVDMDDISLTGHSLGGYLTRTVARVLNVKKAWAFSSPGPSRQTRAYLEKVAPNALPRNKIIHVRSHHDIIGLLGKEENIVLELATKGQHHAIKKIRRHLIRMNGETPPQELLTRKPGFLEHVFNAVSKRLADGVHLYRALQKAARHVREPEPAEMLEAPARLRVG